MFCFTGAATITLTMAFANQIASFFNVPIEQKKDFISLIRYFGLATGISFPVNVLGAAIVAREHFVANNIVSIVRSVLRSLIIVVLIDKGKGLSSLGLAPLISTSVGLIATIYLFYKYAKDISINLKFCNKLTFKKLISYGSFAFIIAIADILRINIDSVVIGKFLALEQVGIYGVAALLLGYMVKFMVSTTNVLSPRFSAIDGSNNTEELKKLFLKSIKISSTLAFGMSFFAICFGPKFIELWAGKGFEDAGRVLIIISLAYAFALSQTPGIGLMYATNNHKYYAIFTILEAVANITLSIILVKHFGIIGVAIGTAIPMVIVKCFVMPYYVSKVIELNVLEYAIQFKTAIIICIILTIITLFAHYILKYNENIFYYFSVAIFMLISYITLAYNICLKQK